LTIDSTGADSLDPLAAGLAGTSERMATFNPDTAVWRKASFSTDGECVVVAQLGDLVAVRNSNHPTAGILFVKRAEMAAWLAGIKAGEFDDLGG
jgi:hypothetical protein